ncbi:MULTISPECIES: hypothetical protein [Flavobacterium]|uniref:Uncharacterized protein n=2 Tax=Flavobacterium TaxID=237 RepID=A0A6V6YYS2_9FLAO|nr:MULTISPECIES: hypothetical protein [Flavobacterium]OOV19093.1 hypothetical protein BXU10_05315 [Flavobacterium sp. LM4]CAD0004404.1 hypothetical protein FLACHUCJ7_01844 [Flavobacterium chungangense]CAD0008031.1 hypothetical protein FLAT13_04160 [Flavobacterium salmonis]
MEKNSNVLTNGQKTQEEISLLEERLQYGDYTTLGLALSCTPDTGKKRFKRGNIEAFLALDKIITSREELVKDLQKKK